MTKEHGHYIDSDADLVNGIGIAPLPKPTSSRLQFTSWGIYTVAYVSTSWKRLSFDSLRQTYTSLTYAGRIYRVLNRSAAFPFFIYGVTLLWSSVAPAVSLWLLSVILQIADQVISTRIITEENLKSMQYLAFTWIVSTYISVLADRLKDDQAQILREHLRAHFLPRLAEASLRFDSAAMQEISYVRSFPQPHEFDEIEPGWDIINVLSIKVRNILEVAVEAGVLLCAISQTANRNETVILTTLCILHSVIFRFLPLNGVGGAGYTFWTNNQQFYRLRQLYTIIFDPKYRDDLRKDGMCDSLQRQYQDASDNLGIVNTNAYRLSWSLRRSWYWDFLHEIVADSPLALYSLTLPWTISASSLATMVLLQQASLTLKASFSKFSYLESHSLAQLCLRAKELYQALEILPGKAEMTKAERVYRPSPISTGMKITFRDVSFRYPNQSPLTPAALDNVTFDIQPGSLVVVVGQNGSGKSSLLKLITSMTEPTSGDCLIDGHPVSHYTASSLREAIAFLSQSEKIYPVSLSMNIQMGLPGGLDLEIDSATAKGGAGNFLQKLGYDKILNPIFMPGISSSGCGNGTIDKAAMEALDHHNRARRGNMISGGERQRLIASRTFMRLENSAIRLLVVDEPTSSVDPLAEQSILSHFRTSHQKPTRIFVTHRFGHLVEHADLILVLEGGRLVQQGSHNELLNSSISHYAELYKAQAQGFGFVH